MSGWQPISTPESEPYWQAIAAGRLSLPHCLACGEFFFYPRGFCPHCGSRDLRWERVSGRGTVASYIVAERPLPGIAEDVPYILAVVDLDVGVRMTSRIVGVEPAHDASILGAPVEVVFESIGDVTLPCFALVEER